jgi:Ca2+-binding EF-hand superfamily protein
VIDLNGDGYIDIKEFVQGFFKIYYSNLESKIKFTFDIYDFDKDGYITRDDVKIILSHIPIENSVINNNISEGAFTMTGGGSQVFLDRL